MGIRILIFAEHKAMAKFLAELAKIINPEHLIEMNFSNGFSDLCKAKTGGQIRKPSEILDNKFQYFANSLLCKTSAS